MGEARRRGSKDSRTELAVARNLEGFAGELAEAWLNDRQMEQGDFNNQEDVVGSGETCTRTQRVEHVEVKGDGEEGSKDEVDDAHSILCEAMERLFNLPAGQDLVAHAAASMAALCTGEAFTAREFLDDILLDAGTYMSDEQGVEKGRPGNMTHNMVLVPLAFHDATQARAWNASCLNGEGVDFLPRLVALPKFVQFSPCKVRTALIQMLAAKEMGEAKEIGEERGKMQEEILRSVFSEPQHGIAWAVGVNSGHYSMLDGDTPDNVADNVADSGANGGAGNYADIVASYYDTEETWEDRWARQWLAAQAPMVESGTGGLLWIGNPSYAGFMGGDEPSMLQLNDVIEDVVDLAGAHHAAQWLGANRGIGPNGEKLEYSLSLEWVQDALETAGNHNIEPTVAGNPEHRDGNTGPEEDAGRAEASGRVAVMMATRSHTGAEGAAGTRESKEEFDSLLMLGLAAANRILSGMAAGQFPLPEILGDLDKMGPPDWAMHTLESGDDGDAEDEDSQHGTGAQDDESEDNEDEATYPSLERHRGIADPTGARVRTGYGQPYGRRGTKTLH